VAICKKSRRTKIASLAGALFGATARDLWQGRVVTAHRRQLLVRAGGVIALAVLLWFIAGFLSAQRACAHDPRFACSVRGSSDPIYVADPVKSWAFYGHLRNGQTEVYEISLARAGRISWSLLVDQRDAYNPARPAALLSTASGKMLQSLDFSRMRRFYEPFSREQYITTATSMLALGPGKYRINVNMRGGDVQQRYTLALGSEERFGLTEIPYVLGAIHRIRDQNY
jgi:hypothetical protein